MPRTPIERQQGLKALFAHQRLDALDLPFCETVALADLLLEDPAAVRTLSALRLREWHQRATAFLEVSEGYQALWDGPTARRPEGPLAHGRA